MTFRSCVMLLLLLPSISFADSDDDRRKKSLEVFEKTVKVFQHPRCLNCHPAGDRPTQGMDMHLHIMNVKRGKDNHGAVAMKCATCHQDHNNDYSKVPGAPSWGLAPKSMAWQGLSKGQLCRNLKDQKKTHKTLEQMIDHNMNDELVAWGWDPGDNREPVPYSQKEFGELFKEWVYTGAECPPI